MKLQWFNDDSEPDNGDSETELFLSIQGKITLNFKR